MGITGKGVKVSSQASQIFVRDIGFEAELVFKGDGERQNEVQRGAIQSLLVSTIPRYTPLGYRVQFSQDVIFSFFTFSLAGIDPNCTREVARRLNELGPIFAPVCPSVVQAGLVYGSSRS